MRLRNTSGRSCVPECGDSGSLKDMMAIMVIRDDDDDDDDDENVDCDTMDDIR